jgi:putative Holliday junction resolvase
VGLIVVGMPLNMNGTEGPMAEEVNRFSKQVSARCGIPVEPWDERLSSYSAQQVLLEADVSRRKRKGLVDKIAAQQILQDYLDSKGQGGDDHTGA